MITIIGWIGTILLGGSALPQAIQSYRTKSSAGLSSAFLAAWGLGEICALIYVVGSGLNGSLPLIANYILNLSLLGVIGYYKVFPNV